MDELRDYHTSTDGQHVSKGRQRQRCEEAVALPPSARRRRVRTWIVVRACVIFMLPVTFGHSRTG